MQRILRLANTFPPALLVITVLGAITHLVPHPAGFSTIGTVGLLAVALLPMKFVPVPVLISTITFDLIHGTYGFAAMSFVYAAHLAAAWSVAPLLAGKGWANKQLLRPARERIPQIAGAGIVSALVFYLISNLTPMALAFYPNTLTGWLTCYINGLPFLLRGIIANLIFAGIAFGALTLWRQTKLATTP